ncbi:MULTISPECIES: PP2C family protein-serine/threonine phosphatase [Calothrix]|uniref:SpoIIE family protein phosphatase n=2 Tax=Calothrix TaxID=1186 RepID=A0ABR8A8K5_9CYAN|nr:MULTISPECIES: GAF domain-containing SpoIIE family protein phosphatase [Calothrix]MBD2196169.1 SpoIIE family protein phosphatase [Calothrix parietina FACHB-288]MBD2224822.1 SpoIIE family protein phosphatase [Calothrix anomala FACHB-343]
MDTHKPLREDQYYEELESLRQEVSTLRSAQAAFEAQRELLAKVVAMARSPEQEEMLKITLEEALQVCCKLTGAETGSLFLLDSQGVVTDSILTQKTTAKDTRSKLIGSVLDKGLAGWVNRHRQIGLITDTIEDERWLQLPNQPYTVRSALAVPILKEEVLLGILTLLHCEPHRFSWEIANLMQKTANEIALVLENAELYAKLEESYNFLDQAKQEIEAYSKALDYELEKGRQIQRDFLPEDLPKLTDWEIAACFYPARQVAGDFYDSFMLPGGYVGLVIADVCDKGVGAALFMALFRSLIRIFSGQTNLCNVTILGDEEVLKAVTDTQISSNLEQAEALKAVGLINNYIAQQHAQMSMFATLFFGVLDPKTGIVYYVNGGHEPLFVIDSQGVKATLKPTGPAVGMMPHMKFKVQQIQLAPGDILIGYTDGVTEARAPDSKLFTSQRLLSLFQPPPASASQLLEWIKTNLFAYMDNAPQFDDITMLAVQRLENNNEGEIK